jgi:ubiquinone/menaquinone biosynthesis C-methylase UbiE
MTDYSTIYSRHAAEYDALVAAEDYRGLIFPALNGIRPLSGLDAVEFGAGTGRLTRLLALAVRRVWAFDASPHMLSVAAQRLAETGADNWTLAAADNRCLPLRPACADLAVEGWSFAHAVGWYPDTWREEVGAMLAEMRRVLHPGGTAVLLETLGTGHKRPTPPTDGLAALYRWLEQEQGFQSTWIRTDYYFNALDEAERLTRFFFGDELADRVLAEELLILPECTGIWWRTY